MNLFLKSRVKRYVNKLPVGWELRLGEVSEEFKSDLTKTAFALAELVWSGKLELVFRLSKDGKVVGDYPSISYILENIDSANTLYSAEDLKAIYKVVK